MAGHVESKKTYYLVFGALLVLTVVTVGVAYINFGFLNTPLALAIATLKAALVILIFMHVRHSSHLTWLFIGSGFLWFLILVGITMADYVSRDWDAVHKLSTWTPAAQISEHIYTSSSDDHH